VESLPLSLSFPDGLIEGYNPPGPDMTMTVEIKAGFENYVPGSGYLNYRYDPLCPFLTAPLTSIGGDLYEAVLPGARPGDLPEYYFSAEGDGGSVVYSPANAPDSVYTFEVCLVELLFTDNFEEDEGWTVESINLTAGEWERGVPAGGGERGDPPTDYDGSGQCFVTENVAGDSDVDGGPTHLISPVIDLSSGDAEISYYRWYTNDDNDDYFTVAVSNDNGGTWVTVEQILDTAGWNYHSFAVSDFVEPTSQIKVRFSAVDNPNDSVTEAGIDAFKVLRIDYFPSIWVGQYSFSAGSGCSIPIYLDAGSSYAGRMYVVGGSMSGAYPGTQLPGGNVIPLNRDVLTNLILNHLNGFMFHDFRGHLDGDGTAEATLNVVGPVNPIYVGKNLTFAFTLLGGFDFVSNPVHITIEP